MKHSLVSTAGLASEAFVGLATVGLLTAHQSLIGKANVTIGDNPPGIGTASGTCGGRVILRKDISIMMMGLVLSGLSLVPPAAVAAEVSGGSYANSDVDSHLNVSSASSGQILSWNGSDYAWVADQTGGGGSGITTANINADTIHSGTLNVSGVSTFAGITTVTGETFFSKQLSVLVLLLPSISLM